MPATEAPRGGRSRRCTALHVLLALLILASCLLTASTWREYAHTWDEPEHIAAGLELLDRGKYEYDTEHPPGVRLLMALGPYLAGARSFGTPPPDGTQEGIDILYTGGHYELFLSLARLGTLPFLAVLLLGTWFWARRVLESEAEALLAVVLTASVPPLLGHAGLATLDVPASAMILLALFALERWMARGGMAGALWLGLAAGGAACTKFSAIPFIIVAGTALVIVHALLVYLDAGTRPTPRPVATLAHWAGGFVLVLAVTLVPIALAYGLRWHGAEGDAGVARRFQWAVNYLQIEPGFSRSVGEFLARVSLPAFAQGFIEGIVAVKAHNDSGHVAYLLGQVRNVGWWYFYLVALAVKTPIPLLLAGPTGLVLLARRGLQRREEAALAVPAMFIAILLFASLFSRINIGIRHVLVLYPLLAIAGAQACAWAWRHVLTWQVPAVRRTGIAVLLGLLAWQVSGMWTENPDYLPYFNPLVRHPERVLVDSDLDWGQDMHRLVRALRELKVPSVALAYRGTADLPREGLPPYVLLKPYQHVTGWVAITALAREHHLPGYAWLSAYTPIERIGRTIDLYNIAEAAPAASMAAPAGAPAPAQSPR